MSISSIEAVAAAETTPDIDSPLEGLLQDPSVTEIIVNGPDEVWVEAGGALKKQEISFSSEEVLRRWVRQVLSARGRKVDLQSPFADCILSDGSRVHVAAPPVSKRGYCVTIRKFPERPWSLSELENAGALSASSAAFLRATVQARKNIFLSGGTGTGKTSLLGALVAEAGPGERIIALEDVAEIQTTHPHFLSLECRPPNQEGEGEVQVRRLLRESLRMRPDRVVVGECRGPEALDLLLALNTGHAGSMGTIHANSSRDAIQRLETLALLAGDNVGEAALKLLIQGGLHVVVQLERRDGKRRVSAISEIKGIDGGRFLLRDIPLG